MFDIGISRQTPQGAKKVRRWAVSLGAATHVPPPEAEDSLSLALGLASMNKQYMLFGWFEGDRPTGIVIAVAGINLQSTTLVPGAPVIIDMLGSDAVRVHGNRPTQRVPRCGHAD